MDILKLILCSVIIIIAILFIYVIIHNKIKGQILKINAAENEIDESLRNKFDLLSKLIVEIIQIDKENKDFIEFEKIKDENLSSFEFERLLKDMESKIYAFKNENSKINKDENFNNIWYEIINLNTKIKGEEKYYNENTTIYNNLVSKFPSNIISKLLRLKEKNYFDGKDMNDDDKKDFKI